MHRNHRCLVSLFAFELLIYAGDVTGVVEFTWRLVACHIPLHASLGTGIGQMATGVVFLAWQSLCKSHLGKSYVHAITQFREHGFILLGCLILLDKSHFSRTPLGTELVSLSVAVITTHQPSYPIINLG